METGNCISEEEVFEIASFKSECEVTGKAVYVQLSNERDEFGLPIVSVIANKIELPLNIEDVPGLINSLILLLKENA